MSTRVKIKLPDYWHFSTDLQVRVSDLNYGNHLANDKVLTLIHEARVRFLRKYGHTEINFFQMGLIQVDAMIVYKSQAFLGDLLTIHLAVSDISKTGCDIYYRITKEQKEIARAKTSLAFFDYTKQKLEMISPAIEKFFQTIQHEH